MRFLTLAFVALCLVCGLGAPVEAQSILTYKLIGEGGRSDRFIGRTPVGTITNGGVRLYADDFRHTRRFALEYGSYDNRVGDGNGLELPKEELDLAGAIPLASGLEFKVATSISRYNISDDFWAVGFYPTAKIGPVAVESGFERDAEKTVHGDGRVSYAFAGWRTYFGGSRETHETRSGSTDETRYGAGLLRKFTGPKVLLYAGSTVNPVEVPTWTVGVARYVDVDTFAAGANPAGILVVRDKPESFYALGIVTLWGRAFSQYSSPDMFRAFFQGSLAKSRVVRNRDFGTLGVGRGYDQVDFGLVSASGTIVDIDVGPGAQLRQAEYALFLTAPRTVGPFAKPFVGLAYSSSSDLVYDSAAHQLRDPFREWATFSFGASVRVAGDPALGRKPGTLRFQLDAKFNNEPQGVVAKGTYWF